MLLFDNEGKRITTTPAEERCGARGYEGTQRKRLRKKSITS
jgi:hypothetical protein